MAAIRATMVDLQPEVVDDLTGGLEADLNDWVADSATGMAALPPAEVYATELRAAAGLPERSSTTPEVTRWWGARHLDAAGEHVESLQAGEPVARAHSRSC